MKKMSVVKVLGLLALLVSIAYGCSKTNSAPMVSGNDNNGGSDTTGNGGTPQLSNVVYGSNTDWQGNLVTLTMDIYQPPGMDKSKKYPLVMHMHGGGYVDGDKTSAADKCQILADSGFIAVTINYRLGWATGGATDPCAGDTMSFNDEGYRAMQDANAALRFLVANADKYNIDTAWIFVSGASAGACVALTSSYIDDAYASKRYPQSAAKLGGLQTADNDLRNKYTIKGICSIAGGLEDSTLINSKRAFPQISFQGELDDVIPPNSGYYLNCTNMPFIIGSLTQYRQLTKLHVPAIANILPGQGHGNNGDSGYDSPFMMGSAACFFHTLMNNLKPRAGVYYGTINTCTD